MKSLITAVASVTILMMFMMQFVANEKTAIRTFAVNSIIENYTAAWRDEGEITEESERLFIEEVSNRLDGKVIINSIDRSKEENGEYSIEIEIRDVIGPIKLIGGSVSNKAKAKRTIKLEKKYKEVTEGNIKEIEILGREVK